MRCAVFNCSANNNNGKSNLRFYVFPKDNNLRKQWIHFCRRKDRLNPNTSRICSAHFTKDDFERNIQFEMGLCKNNGFKLKVGTVPTIQPQSTAATSSRDLRMQSKEKKQMIASLLKGKSVPIDEPVAITDEVIEPNNNIKIIPEGETVKELKQTIRMLKQNVEDLKRDKLMLMEDEMAYEKLTLSLQKRLEKSELERINMEKQLREIFTPGQVNKVKNGMKRLQWSEANTSRSTSAKACKRKIKLMKKTEYNEEIIFENVNVDGDDTPDLNCTPTRTILNSISISPASISTRENEDMEVESISHDGLENFPGYVCFKLED